MPRVVFASHMPDIVGGAERSLVESLTQFGVDPRIEAVALVPSEGALSAVLEDAGVRAIAVPMPHWVTFKHRFFHPPSPARGIVRRLRWTLAWVQAVPPVARELRALHPDLVVTNTISSPVAAVAARLVGVPHVWSVRESVSGNPMFEFALPAPISLRIMGALSTHLLANSAPLAAQLHEVIPGSSVTVVHPGCDTPALSSRPTPSDPGRPLRLLFLGRVEAAKGSKLAVRGLGEAKRGGADATLRFVGRCSPAHRDELAALAIAEGLGGRVELVDPVDDIVPILDASDVLLMCTDFEAFGRSTVEAMRRGVTVIGVDAGGTPELIDDGDNGFLFPPGSASGLAKAIMQLSEDRDLLDRLRTSAWAAVVDRFDPAQQADALAEVLVDVAARSSRNRGTRRQAERLWWALALRRQTPVRRYATLQRLEPRAAGIPLGPRLLDASAPFLLGSEVRLRKDEFRAQVAGVTLVGPRRFLWHFYTRPYEPRFVAWLERNLAPGDVAIDVGAHLGYLTVRMAAAVGPHGRVVAVEPGADNVAYIERNLAANGVRNASVRTVALDDHAGTRMLNIGESSDSYSFFEHPNTATLAKVPVRVQTLDGLMTEANLQRVDVVKIDAEGAELEILAGAGLLLERFPNVKFGIEWNPKMSVARGQRPDAVPRALEALGRELLVLDDQRDRAVTVEEAMHDLEDPALFKTWFANVVDAATV